MQRRKPGNGSLEVSALGLGCMGMSSAYGPPAHRQEMIALIRAAASKITVQGARLPEAVLKMTGR